MASKNLGRTPCPECGFGAAHVREGAAKEGRTEGCVYRYCPQCGAQYHTRTPGQRASLLERTRPEGGQAAPARRAADAEPASQAPASQAPAEPQAQALGDMPHPAAAPARRGLLNLWQG